MSVENKVVADFYVRLFPWVDHARDVRLCTDDGGAGAIAIPDLCFHFLGANDQLRVEFKTFYKQKGGTIGVTNKQYDTWYRQANPDGAPHLWITAVEKGASFYFWRHDDSAFQRALQSAQPGSKTHYRVSVPNKDALTRAAAFMKIMEYAHERRML